MGCEKNFTSRELHDKDSPNDGKPQKVSPQHKIEHDYKWSCVWVTPEMYMHNCISTCSSLSHAISNHAERLVIYLFIQDLA